MVNLFKRGKDDARIDRRGRISCAVHTRRFGNRSPYRAPHSHPRGQPPWFPQKVVRLEPMGHFTARHKQVAPRPKFRGFKFQIAERRLAAAKQPRAGPVWEPARPETTGDSLWFRTEQVSSWTQVPRTSTNANKLQREKNLPKPHATP
jgi:hypothetical protein